jgi:hypothetical protein
LLEFVLEKFEKVWFWTHTSQTNSKHAQLYPVAFVHTRIRTVKAVAEFVSFYVSRVKRALGYVYTEYRICLVPRRYVLFYGLRGLCVGRVD